MTIESEHLWNKAGPLMKKLLNTFLVMNLVVEAPVGISLILAPTSFLSAHHAEAAIWARNYGVAAFAVSTFIFWLWPHRDSYSTTGVALGFLMCFHTILSGALFTAEALLPGAILHSAFALMCIVLYFQRSKWCVT